MTPLPDRSRLLWPARARLAAALAVADAYPDGAACWEALASRGLIPHDWVGSDERAFGEWCSACNGFGLAKLATGEWGACPRCEGRTFLASPTPSPTLAALLAADVPGVVAAERLAQEVASRLVAHAARPTPPRSYWRCEREVIVHLRSWQLVGRPGLAIVTSYARLPFREVVDRDVAAASKAALDPDPFDALFRLYETGYALDALLTTGAVLVAPEA